MSNISEVITALLLSSVVVGQTHMFVTLWYTCRGDKIRLNYLKRHACDNTCMCGSSMDSHGLGDGHAAVSEYEYHVLGFEPTLRG